MAFKGYMNAGTLRYDGYYGMWLAAPNDAGDMEVQFLFKDGVTSRVTLKPIWTLPKMPGTNSVASLQ